MKKFLPLKIVLILAISFLLSACKSLPLSKNEQVTLKYWGLWEQASVVNEVINDYKKDHPNLDVIYEKKSPQQYLASVQSQIKAKKGPDIFMFHNTWVPMLQSELAAIPTSVISQADVKKNYYQTVSRDLKNSQKNLVGLPSGIDGIGLYYNEDILKAAGIASPPATWQELATAAVKLTVRGPEGNIRTAGVALGTSSNIDHFSDILALMILQNGGDLKNPVDQRSADALDFYTSFSKGENRSWDEALPASTIAFVGGNLAMYFAPSWRAAEIKQQNPTLNFKIAPVPQLDANKVTWASYWAIGVSSQSANQQAAFDFLKYLQEDNTLVKLYTQSANTPGRIFGQPYPKLSLAPSLAFDPLVGAYIIDAPYMQTFSMASRTYDNGLNDEIIKAYQDAVNGVIAGSQSTQALKTAAATITQVLSKYKVSP